MARYLTELPADEVGHMFLHPSAVLIDPDAVREKIRALRYISGTQWGATPRIEAHAYLDDLLRPCVLLVARPAASVPLE